MAYNANSASTPKKYPKAKTICIDVDGTLIQNGRLNSRLADWAMEQKAAGFEVILWSAQGKSYAQGVAKKYKIEQNFTVIIGKPGYIVDDLGWGWTKYTRVLKGLI